MLVLFYTWEDTRVLSWLTGNYRRGSLSFSVPAQQQQEATDILISRAENILIICLITGSEGWSGVTESVPNTARKKSSAGVSSLFNFILHPSDFLYGTYNYYNIERNSLENKGKSVSRGVFIPTKRPSGIYLVRKTKSQNKTICCSRASRTPVSQRH